MRAPHVAASVAVRLYPESQPFQDIFSSLSHTPSIAFPLRSEVFKTRERERGKIF
eukprot:c45880_g1_i1 orf=2-163(-)